MVRSYGMVLKLVYSLKILVLNFFSFYKWSHQQPHIYENVSLLEADMILNKNFAIVSHIKLLVICSIVIVILLFNNRNMESQQTRGIPSHHIIPAFIQFMKLCFKCGKNYGIFALLPLKNIHICAQPVCAEDLSTEESW